jgi:hypothetical protein
MLKKAANYTRSPQVGQDPLFPEARPQAKGNRRRTLWGTLRSFLSENEAREGARLGALGRVGEMKPFSASY